MAAKTGEILGAFNIRAVVTVFFIMLIIIILLILFNYLNF